MTSLVKDINISNLTRNNFVITAVVLILIIALFFIPEIIDLQKSFFSSESAPAKTNNDLVKSETPKAVAKVESSPLNRILALIDSGYLDQLKEKRMRGEPIEDDLELALNSNLPLPQDPKAMLDSKAGSVPRFASGEQVTWKTLRAASSLKAFKDARKKGLELANSLAPTYENARYALFNFANGLTKVIDGAEKTMKPEEAMDYLEHLDQSVTDGFLRDRVERSDFLKWAEISLGSLFDQSRSQQMKVRATPKFNPRLTLTYVRIRQPADRFGNFNPNRPALMYIEGFIMGKDAKRMALEKNGDQVRRIAVHKKPDRFGRRRFTIPQRDARGIQSIVVYDRDGNRYVRNFSFYDRARHFRWVKERGGIFDIPFAENDQRFTTYFLVGSGRSSSALGNFGSESSFPMTAF